MRISLPSPIIYLVALLLLLTGILANPLGAQSTEICNNGLDDDGDGLIDCEDEDCDILFIDNGQALGNSESYGLSLGDVDGDGDLDAWVANHDGQPNRVWLNEGGAQGGTPGNFIDSGQAFGSSLSTDVSLGDVDDDGDLDAWVTSDVNRVWLNEGGAQGGTPGIFIDSGQTLGSSYSDGVSLGDVDGDGDLDAWVTNGNGEPNRVWLNENPCPLCDEVFVDSGQEFGNSSSLDVTIGDVDGDGDLDAWVANAGAPNRVWLNAGGIQGGTPGNYIDSGQALGSAASREVALGDVDGDGDLDAWVANS